MNAKNKNEVLQKAEMNEWITKICEIYNVSIIYFILEHVKVHPWGYIFQT